MNTTTKHILLTLALACGFNSCSSDSFLSTQPRDALPPGSTWQTEEDARRFLVGLYDGWASGYEILALDATSDFGYNHHRHEGYQIVGDGSMTQASPGLDFYNFDKIRSCNLFLDKVPGINFGNDALKKHYIAQAKVIRAYRYMNMLWYYGDIPLIDSYETAAEARVPAKTATEVKTFVEQELDEAIPLLAERPRARGEIARAVAIGLRMRLALYYGDYTTAKAKATELIALGQYSLEPNYSKLFSLEGQDSPEIICAVQYLRPNKSFWYVGALLNNGAGGWSSIVPTTNLVNTYEMANGLTKEEAGSGYDPQHPFKGRDPRMAMTVLYPGADYPGSSNKVYNTLDKQIGGVNNEDYMLRANNSSRTGLSWYKYIHPTTQYPDVWSTSVSPILMRYAEVLLTWAEAENELSGPSSEVYDKLDAIRLRVGMPAVDRSKYATQATLRELIRRERGVELAGEGLRRADLLRWQDTSGRMLAETLLNGRLERMVGTVNMSGTNPETRATITVGVPDSETLIQMRSFQPHMRYLPLPQTALDNNKQLKQRSGY